MQQPLLVPDGLMSFMSSFGQTETMCRLREAITEQGMAVVVEIDHAASARAVQLPLRPTAVLVFGNALAGTPLMQAAPTIGIDLPLKVLVWTDEDGTTWLAYNDPDWLAARHGVQPGNEATLDAMRKALATVRNSVSGPDKPGPDAFARAK